MNTSFNLEENFVPFQSLSKSLQHKCIVFFGDPYKAQHKDTSMASGNLQETEIQKSTSVVEYKHQPRQIRALKKGEKSGCECALHLRKYCPSNDSRISQKCNEMFHQRNSLRKILGGRSVPKSQVCIATLNYTELN